MLSKSSDGIRYSGKDLAEERDSAGAAYFSENEKAPFEWYGEGAQAIGLNGKVDAEIFDALKKGELPTGEKLPGTDNPDNTVERRAGEDFVWSAPKSVSILAEIGGDTRIHEAMDRVARQLADRIQQQHVGTRQMVDGQQKRMVYEDGTRAVMAIARHSTSRPVNGQADPQTHVHIEFLNVAQRPDGEWRATSWDMPKGYREDLGAWADAQLAREMQKIGYETEKNGKSFEISGISKSTREEFSQRTKQIEAELVKKGKSIETASYAERKAATLNTREGKLNQSHAAQAGSWEDRAERIGALDEIRQTIQKSKENDLVYSPEERQKNAVESIKSAMRHLSERESVVDEQRLITESLTAGMGKAVIQQDITDVLKNEALLEKNGVIHAQKDKEWTTTEQVARDEKIIQHVKSGKDAVKAIYTEAQASAYIEKFEQRKGFSLSPGQRDAVTQALTSTDRLSAWQGYAGAGKTTAVEAVHDAAKDEGFQVVGLAPTAKAASELSSAGIQADTIAKWQAGGAKGNENTIFIIDEAGMISSKDMEQLLDRIEKTGARGIPLGDWRQLQSVEYGAPFKLAQEKGESRTAVISEIRRQNDEKLKATVEKFAGIDGARIKEAAQEAKQYMHKVEYEKGEDKIEAISKAAANAYVNAKDRNNSVVVVDTNKMRKAVNDNIREQLKERGEMQDGIKTRVLEKKDLSKEQQRHAQNLKPGDKVIFRRDYDKGAKFKDAERQKELTDTKAAQKADYDKAMKEYIAQLKQNMDAKSAKSAGYQEVKRPEMPKDSEHVINKFEEYTVKEVDIKKNTATLENRRGEQIEWDMNKTSAEKYTAYTEDNKEFSKGDKIRFRENQRLESPDGKEVKVNNGATGRVKEITEDGSLVVQTIDKKGEQKEVIINSDDGVRADYGYSGTVHAVQGATIEGEGKVIGAIDSESSLSSAEQGYVTLSRLKTSEHEDAKERMEIYTDNTDKLAEKWSESKVNRNAVEHVTDEHLDRFDLQQAQRDLSPIEPGKWATEPEKDRAQGFKIEPDQAHGQEQKPGQQQGNPAIEDERRQAMEKREEMGM